MAEASERKEDEEHSQEGDLAEFREKLLEDYGPEELEPPDWSDQQESKPEHPPEQLPAEATADKDPSVGQEGHQGEEPAGPAERAQTDPHEVEPPEAAASSPKESIQEEGDEPEAGTQGKTRDDTEGSAESSPESVERPDAESPANEARPEPTDKADIPDVPRIEDAPEAAPTRIESFNQNDNQVVVTEHEGPEGTGKAQPAPDVETWDFRRFPSGDLVEREEEVRTFEVVDYGKGGVVRLPKTDLEEAGAELEPGQNKILQVGLRDVESEEVETAFARYNGSDRRAEVYVGDIGGTKGSRCELVEAREVDEDTLVKEFEKGKCEHLQNVTLEHADEKMFLNVDGRRVELEDYRISTSGSHAVLRGKLDGDDRCKVEFDGRRASVMFGRDYPVEGMWMEGDVLAVKYAQSRNMSHEHRMYLEHLESPERPSLSQFDRPEMLEHVKMFDHPERVQGLYQFVLDKEARDEIKTLLRDADRLGDSQHNMMKAEISERVVPNMMELVGWERVERHPFNKSTKEGASANGTDWMMRTPAEKLALIEIKWQGNKENAMRKGESQVARSFDEHRPYKGLEVEAAYIAIVDWTVDEEPIKIYVKRVRPEESLS